MRTSLLAFLLSITPAAATTYTVGPGQQLETLTRVPWGRLAPGDEVVIHWREEPYAVKWVFNRPGTADKPIVVRGVRGPDGQRPVITGKNAVTPRGLDYKGSSRSVIKIGYSNIPSNRMPSYLTVEGLEIRGARPGNYSASRRGIEQYVEAASAVYVEIGEHITLRDCKFADCGNGLFVAYESSEVLVDRCEFEGNGVEESVYHHNAYTEARGITYQFCTFGRLRPGARGNNLKDRSAGLIVRNCWIEGGNRQLDLVESQDDGRIKRDPRYEETWVVGNVLIESEKVGNNQILHFGGDSGDEDNYRSKLYFYNNTVVSTRPKTCLMRLSTNRQTCDMRNCIVQTTSAGGNLSLLDETGRLGLKNNWIRVGYKDCFGRLAGVVRDEQTLTGKDPGFVDAKGFDFRLTSGSPCIDAGTVRARLPQLFVPWLAYDAANGSRPWADAGTPDLGALPTAK